jgi:hypothetical protein
MTSVGVLDMRHLAAKPRAPRDSACPYHRTTTGRRVRTTHLHSRLAVTAGWESGSVEFPVAAQSGYPGRVDQPRTVLHDSRRTEISHRAPPLSMQVASDTTTFSPSSAAMPRTMPFATPHILRLEL